MIRHVALGGSLDGGLVKNTTALPVVFGKLIRERELPFIAQYLTEVGPIGE
jgi:hypothetical protein